MNGIFNCVLLVLFVAFCEGNEDILKKMEARFDELEGNFVKMKKGLEQRILKLETVAESVPNDWPFSPVDSKFAKLQDDFSIAPGQISDIQKMNDINLEQRVQVLELKMENVQENIDELDTELSDLDTDVTNVEGQLTIINTDLSILSQGQRNQDEKIEDLDDVSEGLNDRVTSLEDEDGTDESIVEAINQLNADVQYLNGTAIVLDSKIVVLEDQGDIVIESVNQLSINVQQLNGTFEDLVGTVASLETTDEEFDHRLETLESLDVTSEIDGLASRLDALEADGSLAFHVGFTDGYPVIPTGGVAVWDYIFTNLGDGYNKVTGEFVVPRGGAGLYYFSASFLFDDGEIHFLNIRNNGEVLCTAFESKERSGDWGGSACGAVVQLAEGDVVDVYHLAGSDDTPCEGYIGNSNFSGFRIAPK